MDARRIASHRITLQPLLSCVDGQRDGLRTQHEENPGQDLIVLGNLARGIAAPRGAWTKSGTPKSRVVTI